MARKKSLMSAEEIQEMANVIIEKEIQPLFDTKEPFQIISAVRYDPIVNEEGITIEPTEECFFLIDRHCSRLNLSTSYFGWKVQVSKELLMEKLIESVKAAGESQSLKCRVYLDEQGNLNVATDVIPAKPFGLFEGLKPLDQYSSLLWDVVVSPEPIGISPFTSFKTTNRGHYNKIREATLKGGPEGRPQEVLLYNTAGQVTEGSVTNVAFYRKFPSYVGPEKGTLKWITPPLSTGPLCGVTRAELLAREDIVEDRLFLKDIKDGEDVLLMNGIQGVVRGKIRMVSKSA
ncbi:Aminodeoxychorismate lyase [Komagataella phaffii]|uniref:Aminodeoxychorismate lyase n=2 Tax=Komagataella phaffii TaxID=460519 RepID=C4R7E6_KOMPG|nr:uncharacterized protein PAS_chr4_0940 [Komagataella phaffii GS115]CAY71521.1 hypothetical protein PAS_chr4_0940 [Komagataella phaffii GS115]